MLSTTTNLQNTIKGAVDTSQIKVTVNFGGSIGVQDISSYVLDASGRSEETFALTQGANANRCNLTLDNSDGRFSPRNTTGPYYGGLTPNKPITISVIVGSDSLPIFTGYTSVWNPSAKAYTCQVEGFDAAVALKRKKVISELAYNQNAPTTGLTWNWVFERAAWLAGIRWDWVTTYDATYASNSQANYNSDGSVGTPTTITVVPNNTLTTAIYRLGGSGGTLSMRVDIARSAAGAALTMKATNLSGFGLDLLSQLAQVIDGKLFFDAQGALRLRSRMYVSDSSYSDTVTIDNLDDSNYSQNYEGTTQVPMVNSVTVSGTPLDFRLDANGNIVEETTSFLSTGYLPFTGGQTYPGSNDVPYYVTMPNGLYILQSPGYPSASNFAITSTLTTDSNALNANGVVWASGYPIFSANQIQLKFVNNNASAVNVTKLDLKAKLVAPRLKIQGFSSDLTSINNFGQRDKVISNDFIPNSLAANNLANWTIAAYKDLQDVLTTPLVHGMPWLELGDTLQVSETITNTVPTATNYVIRSWTWKYSLDAYTQSFELVPPAPAFTLQTAVTNTSPVAAYQQTGAKADSFPPSSIGSTLYGLQNIPAIMALTNTTRKLVNTAAGIGAVNGVAYYKGFIWCAANGGYVFQIDPLTMAILNTYQVGTSTDYYFDCKVYGRYLYFCGLFNVSGTYYHQLAWFDLDNPGTVSGTNWGIKVRLDTLATSPVVNPTFMDLMGTKLYAHCHDANGPTFQGRIVRVDVTTNANVTTVEVNQATTSGYTSAIGNGLRNDGTYVWCVARDSSNGLAISTATAAGATSITLASIGSLAVGDPIKVDNSGGSNTDVSYVTAINGTTITVSPALVKAHPTTDYVYRANTTISRFNPGTGTVDQTTVVNDGPNGQGIEWDGQRYLWVTYMDKVARYSIQGGSIRLDAISKPSGVSAGAISFDGSYLWWCRAGSINQIDPRTPNILVSFSNDSTTGGFSLFDGRSIFVSGSSGAIYQVPRWTSQQY